MAQIPNLELNIVPHCFDCVSWSSDGDIAIAGEEAVHILTPVYEQSPIHSQPPADAPDPTTTTSTTDDSPTPRLRWSQSKFQANVFTEAEWPTVTYPAPLSTLSVGEEQSNSHVTALAFAPAHSDLGNAWRRPVLAVLTSNLILAIWESLDGTRWVRRTTANQAVGRYFDALGLEDSADGMVKRLKQRARSFAWSPGCTMAVPGGGSDDDGDSEAAANQHGRVQRRKSDCILAVGNDCGDVIFLAFNRTDSRVDDGSPTPTVVTHHTLSSTTATTTGGSGALKNHLRAQPSSILARTTVHRQYISCLTWSKWVLEPNVPAAVSHVALLYGGELRVLRVEKEVGGGGLRVSEVEVRFAKGADGSGNDDDDDEEMIITGPICWDKIIGHAWTKSTFSFERQSGRSFISPIDHRPHDFIVSEFTAADDGHGAINIHTRRSQQQDRYSPVSTIVPVSSHQDGFYVASHMEGVSCVSVRNRNQLPTFDAEPPISREITRFRSAYDTEHVLAGNSVARIWGIAPYTLYTNTAADDEDASDDAPAPSGRPESVCACFTLHPTDLVETLIPSQVMMRIVFAPVKSDDDDDAAQRSATVIPYGELSAEKVGRARRGVLGLVLQKFLHQQQQQKEEEEEKGDSGQSQPSTHTDTLYDKLVYAAACCSMMSHSQDTHLRGLARAVIDRLAERYPAVDFAQERVFCDNECRDGEERRITAKTDADKAAAAIAEVCEICGAGLVWYEANEAQCSEGHVFTRCGLTFLAIQDPYISKFCSRCNTEYLNERAILARQSETLNGGSDNAGAGLSFLMELCRTFDTCIYCGGKFAV